MFAVGRGAVAIDGEIQEERKASEMSTAPSPHEEDPPAVTVQSPVVAEATIAGRPTFSPAEMTALQSEDKQATIAVCGILVACFSLGLLIYLTVLLSCLWGD